jgi:hypothetical protein
MNDDNSPCSGRMAGTLPAVSEPQIYRRLPERDQAIQLKEGNNNQHSYGSLKKF